MRIVCATDFSPPAGRAAEIAAALAKRLRGSLALVHVVEAPIPGDVPVTGAPRSRELVARAEELLGLEADRIGGDVPVQLIALYGTPVETILEYVADNGGDLVVAGHHGRAAGVRWFGSTVTRLARHAFFPMLVVREGSALPASLRILVGVDADRSFSGVMPMVRQLEAIGPCRVDYVHVVEPMAPMPMSEPIAFPVVFPELDDEPEDGIEKVVGRPDLELPRLAAERGADLIALGSHGRHGLDRALMGSTAAAVLRRAACAVLIAPSRESLPAHREAPPPAP
jgi:nucleotide-binding universal stress UspA family protein